LKSIDSQLEEGGYKMVKTASTMLPLGTTAPGWELPDVVSGNLFGLDSFADKRGLLVMFICRHCPYVVHVHEELARLGHDYQGTELGIVAISSNDAENYPDDTPDKLAEISQKWGFSFPFCYDETQEVAKAYTAACTPDFFLFDSKRKLVYRGQLDGSRPGNDIPVDGRDLRKAIDAVLADKEVPSTQRPSLGCNIKWKPDNEPSYFKM
jgi:thiol-disulfide isomerase/thioredoxin